MYLQRIELQGFKSFAQKTILEFPAPGKGCLTSPNVDKSGPHAPRGICGTTAIVGPNGSGKSNVVDAVRWVLGEQSLKLLRGKKATDVIFSGSSKKSQMGFAEVSLFLNNEDKSAPIDFSEVAITRKLYRDGNSEYCLNKRRVRLFDIVMLLAKTSFGQNTYSVIGQGMVDRIVNFSSQDRKDFFDEATGVKQFQIKRDKSVNKLKRSRENLAQAQVLTQELAPHLRSLTRQVNRLRKRQAVETELRDLQVNYYGKKWLDLDSGYQHFALNFANTEKEKIKLDNQINEVEEQLGKLSQEKGRAEEFNALQTDYDGLATQKNDLLRQLAEVKGKLDVEYLKVGKQDLSWLEARQDKLKNQIKEIESKVSDAKREVGRFQGILDEKIKTQEEVVAEFKGLEEKLLSLQKEFQSELGVSEKEIRQAINRIYSLQKDFISRLKSTHDLENLKKLKVEAEVVFGEVEEFYQKISQEEKKQQPAVPRGRSEEMVGLQSKLSEFLTSKDSLVNEINEIKIKLEVASSQGGSLKAKAEELKVDLDKVEADLAKNKIDPGDKNQVSTSLQNEKEALQKQVDEADAQLSEMKQKIDSFNEQEEAKKQKIFSLQQEVHKNQTKLNEVVGKLNEIKVELAKIETKKEDLFALIRQDLGEDYRPQNVEASGLKDFDLEEAEDKIAKLRKQLELIGGTDPAVEAEYNEIKERHDFLKSQGEDLGAAIKDLEKVVVELDKMIKKQFENEFKKINRDFAKYFKQLFDGGKAQLVLSQKEITEAEEAREQVAEADSESVGLPEGEEVQGEAEEEEEKIVYVEDKSFLSNTGIDIEACPPGKKIKNINVLSGGEKTMTALALVCAIISNNPSPFVLFDEVDAALDEANSTKFSNIVEELAHKTQFVIITHNRAIMARANVLYGVTMQGDGISRLLSLKLDEAEKLDNK